MGSLGLNLRLETPSKPDNPCGMFHFFCKVIFVHEDVARGDVMIVGSDFWITITLQILAHMICL